MLELRWPSDSQRELGAVRNANWGGSQKKKNIFITCKLFARIASNLRFAIFRPLKHDSQKGVQFRNPETIRENQAIRANLQIDSRESGHLSARINTSSRHRCMHAKISTQVSLQPSRANTHSLPMLIKN